MKRVNEIPDWFRLENYQGVENLSPTELYHQLTARSNALGDLEVYGTIQDEFEYPIHEIRAVGLPGSLASLHENSTETDDYHDDRNEHLNLGGAVYPLSAIWMMAYASCVNGFFDDVEEKLETGRTNELKPFTNRMPWDIFLKEYIEDETAEDGRANIVIDMNLPDTEIIEQFKEFLPLYRQKLGIEPLKKRPTEANLNKLYEYRILPYLDLRIWELENDVQIKRSVLATALYPDGAIGESGILKKVQPLATEATSEAFLKMLKKTL